MGHFWKEIWRRDISKIAHYGHTAPEYPYILKIVNFCCQQQKYNQIWNFCKLG